MKKTFLAPLAGLFFFASGCSGGSAADPCESWKRGTAAASVAYEGCARGGGSCSSELAALANAARGLAGCMGFTPTQPYIPPAIVVLRQCQEPLNALVAKGTRLNPFYKEGKKPSPTEERELVLAAADFTSCQ